MRPAFMRALVILMWPLFLGAAAVFVFSIAFRDAPRSASTAGRNEADLAASLRPAKQANLAEDVDPRAEIIYAYCRNNNFVAAFKRIDEIPDESVRLRIVRECLANTGLTTGDHQALDTPATGSGRVDRAQAGRATGADGAFQVRGGGEPELVNSEKLHPQRTAIEAVIPSAPTEPALDLKKAGASALRTADSFTDPYLRSQAYLSIAKNDTFDKDTQQRAFKFAEHAADKLNLLAPAKLAWTSWLGMVLFSEKTAVFLFTVIAACTKPLFEAYGKSVVIRFADKAHDPYLLEALGRKL